MKITEADLPETQYIYESHSGVRIEPVKILETEFGRIYIRLANYSFREQYVVYGNFGTGPLDLSSINAVEFEKALEVNKRRKRMKSVFIDCN